MGEGGDESLRSLSIERFSGEGERRDGNMAVVVAFEGSGRGPCRAWRHDVVICLHKCADIVYVGDMLMVILVVVAVEVEGSRLGGTMFRRVAFVPV